MDDYKVQILYIKVKVCSNNVYNFVMKRNMSVLSNYFVTSLDCGKDLFQSGYRSIQLPG